MARRTKDELLAELRHLGGLLSAWQGYQMAHGSASTREVYGRKSQRTKDWIAGALEPGAPRLSDLVAGFQQAVNDISEQIGHALDDGSPEGRGFLAFYRERTGREWWADAGDPAKMARAILRRGRIRDETEWYLLKNILSNVDQTIFSAAEVERLGIMRLKFEEKANE